MRYMLDTNACIGVIKGTPPVLRRRLLDVPPGEVAISQIVHYELRVGVCRSRQVEKNRANLEHFLGYIRVMDFGEHQSAVAAELRCDLTRKGQPIGPLDTLIAAHAHSLNAILITHNTSEFQRVDGLLVEDWESL
ncbi:MAG: type II toxin-antitoxin system VapC family toxin [Magnetococcales bacterium]|nr:type II toxin-antitoxin system VapC family toxin [Magnetococcales bacterium]